MEKQKSLNINISYYFIETLASPHANTWHHIGGPITQTIDHLFLNHNHRRSVEHNWKTMIKYKAGGLVNRENITKKHSRHYLLSSSSEINLIENSMHNRIVLCYTIILINCHRQTHGYNAVSKFTVNLAFRRLQTKITKIQKIQQGIRNKGNWKESRC